MTRFYGQLQLGFKWQIYKYKLENLLLLQSRSLGTKRHFRPRRKQRDQLFQLILNKDKIETKGGTQGSFGT